MRTSLIISILSCLTLAGCVKETYDMNSMSKKEYYSPTMAFPAVTGNVSFQNLNLDLNVRVSSLQLIDTLKNFMKTEGSADNNPIKPENFDLIYLDLAVKNGFPFMVSIQMSLYNSISRKIEGTVDASGLLSAAPVDKYGKVTTPVETNTEIKFSKEFLSNISTSDKIIFYFTFNTTDNGANFVSIYPTYKIFFSAVLIFKPDINLK